MLSEQILRFKQSINFPIFATGFSIISIPHKTFVMQNDASSSNEQPNKGERLTPKELFKKHLKDPNHHVTDDELRNLKVGVEAEDEVQVNSESDVRKDEVQSFPDTDALPNPYNVLK